MTTVTKIVAQKNIVIIINEYIPKLLKINESKEKYIR
jgi:hypothetical protein